MPLLLVQFGAEPVQLLRILRLFVAFAREALTFALFVVVAVGGVVLAAGSESRMPG